VQDYILKMEGMCKEFPGVKALDNAKLYLKKGSVHALMGENGAGKSTLMKCLFGVYKEDAGDIFIDGEKINFDSPAQALKNGVAMVHQELNQVLQRDVMDNIWLGRYPKKGLKVDRKKMLKDTEKIFEELEINVDPKIKMARLSVSERQMVEIAKAVSYDAKILVLDEPTSSLNEEEVGHLFKIIRKLKEKKCGIIYISHKMEEILEICDEVTVMRDGRWVNTASAQDITTDKIIKLMVGRDLSSRFPPKTNKPSEIIMEVKNLSGMYPPAIKNVSFELKKGEILGVAGLVGSRRSELLETIFGIAKKRSGDIFLHSELKNNNNPTQAIKNGFALITEERRATGIFEMLSIEFNSVIANIKKYAVGGVLKNRKIKGATRWVIDSMRVKTPSDKTHIRTLSGGNQQKVIIGRWLLTEPEVLLLDEPTRGIDVGAKYEIYQLIIDLANKNKGVIMVSSEMPELLGICDRILVMSNGRVAGIRDVKDVTQEEILELSAKYL